MTYTEIFRQSWNEAFPADSKQWVDFFFENVFDEECLAVLRNSSSEVVSSLLMLPYRLNFHGTEIPTAYICGANTRRRHRGQGSMQRLLDGSLEWARESGYTWVTLIPASRRLFEFYKKKGFRTVFYNVADRYTSMHPFHVEGTYHPATDIKALASDFCSLERCLTGRLLHSEADFLNIVKDIEMDGGSVAAVRDEAGETAAFAFGVHADDVLLVKDVVARDNDAARAALRQLRGLYSDLPFKVLRPVRSDLRPGVLRPYAMAVTVNPLPALQALASAYPKWHCTIELTDRLLPANTGLYSVNDGAVTFVPGISSKKADYSLCPSVLTQLLFCAPNLGKMIDFPGLHPFMSLMLD